MSGTWRLFNPFGDPGLPACYPLTTTQLHSFHMLAKQCSKFAKLGFNSTRTDNFEMFKLDIEKAEEPEIKLSVFIGDHRRGKRIPGKKSTSLSTLKSLTVWIITNCGKFLKRWEYRTTLTASSDPCMQVRRQQLELDMEERTCSKIGKEYIKNVYCPPAYLTYMPVHHAKCGAGWSTSWNHGCWEKYQ